MTTHASISASSPAISKAALSISIISICVRDTSWNAKKHGLHFSAVRAFLSLIFLFLVCGGVSVRRFPSYRRYFRVHITIHIVAGLVTVHFDGYRLFSCVSDWPVFLQSHPIGQSVWISLFLPGLIV